MFRNVSTPLPGESLLSSQKANKVRLQTAGLGRLNGFLFTNDYHESVHRGVAAIT